MIKLNSSSIRAADYDSSRRLLYIWFRHNGPYTFFHVPEHVFAGLVSAASPGTYYNDHIRGRYTA